jgi:dephospho-CoA kinase
MKHIYIIGMTGPTGSGKTSVAKIFEGEGIPAVVTDDIARGTTAPGTPAFREITAAFGTDVVAQDGTLNRAALAGLVFADESKNRLLCDITHPLITIEIRKILRELIVSGKRAVLIDAPLLFESNVCKMCDYTFAVLAPLAERRQRIMNRDGLTPERAESRLAAQKDDEYYISRSNAVIVNDGTPAELRQKTLVLMETIRNHSGKRQGVSV